MQKLSRLASGLPLAMATDKRQVNLRQRRRRWSFGGVTFDPQCLRRDTAQLDPRRARYSLLRDSAMGEGEAHRRARMAQADFLLGV